MSSMAHASSCPSRGPNGRRRRPQRVVTREELHALVWGGRYRRDDRSVDVYVHKLRTKLEEALPDWRFIHTHFGLGYRFSAELSHGVHSPETNGQNDRAR